jgi:hypothetical protein
MKGKYRSYIKSKNIQARARTLSPTSSKQIPPSYPRTTPERVRSPPNYLRSLTSETKQTNKKLSFSFNFDQNSVSFSVDTSTRSSPGLCALNVPSFVTSMPYILHGPVRGHSVNNILLRATGVNVQLPKSFCGYPLHSWSPSLNGGSDFEKSVVKSTQGHGPEGAA